MPTINRKGKLHYKSISGDDYVVYPVTEGRLVTMSDGSNVEKAIDNLKKLTKGIKFDIIESDWELNNETGLYQASLFHNLNIELEGFSIGFYDNNESINLDYHVVDNNNMIIYSDEIFNLTVSIKQSVDIAVEVPKAVLDKIDKNEKDIVTANESINTKANIEHTHSANEITDLVIPEVDLSDYYNKAEVDEKVANITCNCDGTGGGGSATLSSNITSEYGVKVYYIRKVDATNFRAFNETTEGVSLGGSTPKSVKVGRLSVDLDIEFETLFDEPPIAVTTSCITNIGDQINVSVPGKHSSKKKLIVQASRGATTLQWATTDIPVDFEFQVVMLYKKSASHCIDDNANNTDKTWSSSKLYDIDSLGTIIQPPAKINDRTPYPKGNIAYNIDRLNKQVAELTQPGGGNELDPTSLPAPKEYGIKIYYIRKINNSRFDAFNVSADGDPLGGSIPKSITKDPNAAVNLNIEFETPFDEPPIAISSSCLGGMGDIYQVAVPGKHSKKHTLLVQISTMGNTLRWDTSEVPDDFEFQVVLMYKRKKEDTSDLSNYYTREEVDSLINAIVVPPVEDTHKHKNMYILDQLGELNGILTFNGKLTANDTQYSYRTLPEFKAPKATVKTRYAKKRGDI